MNPILQNDLREFPDLLQQALAEGLQFLEQLDHLPTSVISTTDTEEAFREAGIGGAGALAEFRQRYRELMIASPGPRYWGFVTGGTTPAAIMGDMLATIFDQNTQTIRGHGDLSGRIELETISWLRELFGLPDSFLGGMVTGATMSNFTCLAVARQWIGEQHGLDFAKNGISRPVKVLAAVPHSSSIKSLSMLGLGSRNIELIPTIDSSREAIDISALKEKIHTLDGSPFILISSGGTVNTVDYDDFKAISELRHSHAFWWHIDAAFGGFAALSDEHQSLLAGWENADSITIDGHKWLNVPYESAFFFIKEQHKFLQVATFQNANAPYLGDPLENFNFLNFLPENSRRLKALATWFTLRAYGKQGYRDIIAGNIAQARELGTRIQSSSEFELLAPVRLNTVCFTLKNAEAEKVRTFLNALNDTGKVFMTPTVYHQRNGIRAALVNWRTKHSDISLVWKEMKKIVTAL